MRPPRCSRCLRSGQFAEMRDIFIAYDVEHTGELNRARFTEAFLAAGAPALHAASGRMHSCHMHTGVAPVSWPCTARPGVTVLGLVLPCAPVPQKSTNCGRQSYTHFIAFKQAPNMCLDATEGHTCLACRL